MGIKKNLLYVSLVLIYGCKSSRITIDYFEMNKNLEVVNSNDSIADLNKFLSVDYSRNTEKKIKVYRLPKNIEKDDDLSIYVQKIHKKQQQFLEKFGKKKKEFNRRNNSIKVDLDTTHLNHDYSRYNVSDLVAFRSIYYIYVPDYNSIIYMKIKQHVDDY